MKVNKLSLKQGGGNVEQPTHQMPDGTVMPGETHQQAEEQPVIQPPAQQQDPAIAQISEMVNSALQEGQDPVSIVMALIEQDVDQNIIAQAFITGGYAEEDVVTLFENVQQKSQPPAEASAEEQTKDPQEIARNQSLEEEAALAEAQQAETLAAEQDAMSQNLTAKSGIEIKPENEGKFTKWAKARGMSVSEAYNKVMSNKEKYATNVVKMANFAKNAAGWNKAQDGVEIPEVDESFNSSRGQYSPDGGSFESPESKALNISMIANDKMLREAMYPREGGSPYQRPQATEQFKKGGEFEPHFMYKGERKIRAKDMETHLRLKEAGYGHDAPKAQTGLEVDKKGNTFIDGVVQAKDEWTAAPSYVNPLAFESGNNFSITDAAQVLGTGINKLLGSGDKNEDGLRDGFLRDAKGKRALRNQQKGDYYNYEIKLDPNDPNAYGYDNLDLYNTSKGNGGLRDLQTFTDDVKENSRLNYNTETGKYDALISSRELNDDIYGERKGFLGIGKKEGNSTYELGKNFNYFDNIDDETRQQIIDFGNASKNGMPEGTTLSIDPETGAVSNPFPGVDNPNEYDTMMGYNKYGKKEAPKSMIPTNVDGQPVAAINNTPPRVPQLSFLEWTMQDSVRRTGANAQQQYQDYLDGVQSNSTIQSNQPSLLDKVGTGLNEAGEFIKDKYNEAKPFIQQGVDQAGKSIMQAGDFVEDKVNTGLDFLKNIKFEEGGDLPKAQGGMFDFDFTPYFDEEQQAGQENYFANLGSGQTNYMEDTQNVADAQLLKENPGLGPTPQQQETNAMFTPQAKLNTTPFADPADLVDPAVAVEEEDELFKGPQVKRTNKLQGGIDRFLDSKEVGVFKDVSTAAVQVAGVANDFFRQRGVNEAVANNRANLTADEVYGTNEDPFMKRGAWDINTGTFGSEGQRTVRTNMGIAKDGGGINNAGFKALPPQAQQNILDNMLYGGDPNPGITALRKVAPQVVSKMGYKGGGETINVNSTILAKLIAAGADIEIL